jgi:hypothetical protein
VRANKWIRRRVRPEIIKAVPVLLGDRAVYIDAFGKGALSPDGLFSRKWTPQTRWPVWTIGGRGKLDLSLNTPAPSLKTSAKYPKADMSAALELKVTFIDKNNPEQRLYGSSKCRLKLCCCLV